MARERCRARSRIRPAASCRPSRSRSAMPVSGLERGTTTTDARASSRFRNLPPNPYHVSVEAQGFQKLERDVDVRSGVPIEVDVALGSPARPTPVEVVGHAEDLLERDPTAHTDIDQSLIDEAADRVLGWPEPGDHAGVAGRRRRLERLLPSDRRSRADAVLDRQPAGHRSAEPDLLESDLAGRGAVDGDDHRRRAGRVRRQEQPRRPHRHQVGPRSAEADRQRVVRIRIVQEPDRRGQPRRAARTRSATFSRSAAMRTDRFLDPPEFAALHDTGNSAVVLRSARRAPDDDRTRSI